MSTMGAFTTITTTLPTLDDDRAAVCSGRLPGTISNSRTTGADAEND